MGYNLKTPPWDIPELKQDNIISFGPIVSFGTQNIDMDCSVDLKLGGLGDIRNSGLNMLKDPRVSSMDSSSSSGSSKRARALPNGSQAASCLVDGCDSDLSKCRDYHRRHKVCELHSKTPRVTIGGNEQRFCQQCSRFHSLVEFDEGKRSCRKRLDGHNRRRRKPQPESSSLNPTKFLSGHQGTRVCYYLPVTRRYENTCSYVCESSPISGSKMLPFGSPQLYPSNSVASSAWDGTVKPPNDGVLYNSAFHGSVSQSYRGDKHFPFLQGTESTLGCCQPLLSPNSTMGEGGGSSRQKLFSDGLNQVVDSTRARSLLSSSHAETREFGSRRAVQASSISPAQTMIPGMQYGSLGMEAGALGSIFAADGSNNNLNTSTHSQEMFQIDYNNGGSSGNGSDSHQTISFSWE